MNSFAGSNSGQQSVTAPDPPAPEAKLPSLIIFGEKKKWKGLEDLCMKKFQQEVMAEVAHLHPGSRARTVVAMAAKVHSRIKQHLRGLGIDWKRSQHSVESRWARIANSDEYNEMELPEAPAVQVQETPEPKEH